MFDDSARRAGCTPSHAAWSSVTLRCPRN